MKEEAINYLKAKYSDTDIDDLIDQEIISGNWVSQDDIDEDDDVEDEHDWYEQYGRGEAESAVRTELEQEVLAELGITAEVYKDQAGEDLYETIQTLFPKLDA